VSLCRASKKLAVEGKHTIAAQIIQRGLECSKRLLLCLMQQSSATWPRAVPSDTRLPSVSIDWDALDKRTQETRADLLALFGLIVPAIATLRQRKDLPDYFGQSYWLLAEESVQALLAENATLFARVFPAYFMQR